MLGTSLEWLRWREEKLRNVNAIAARVAVTSRTPAQHRSQGDAYFPFTRQSALGGAAMFLASDAAAYMQGHILAADGGWLAR